jgi:hypothetical protein
MSVQPYRSGIGSLLLLISGCSGGPDAVDAPHVDSADAAANAIELYDANKDETLSAEELTKCPAMQRKLAAYDADGNGSVEQAEIEKHLAELFKHGTGATPLSCRLRFKGRPLGGAEVVFEPEPFLGSEVQAARGTTSGSGAADMGIPPEFLPSHLQKVKAVHYGVFKVRVTHPTIKLPANLNTETVLGYETEIGNPSVVFNLDKPGDVIDTSPMPPSR